MSRLVWISCCFYMLIGLASVVTAALLPELMAYYGKDYADGGNLIFSQFFGFLLGVVTQPLWSKRFGRSTLLTFTLCFVFTGYLIAVFLPSWPVVLLCMLLVGIGSGMIEATIGALVIDSVADKKAIAMGRLEVFYGAGALSMPMVISYLIAIRRWELTFIAVALMALLLSVAWIRFSGANRQWIDTTGAPAAAATGQRTKIGGGALPMLICSIAVFFIYAGLEMSIVNFLPSILLESMRMDAAIASLSVSFYWGTMVLGRLVCGYLGEKYGYSRYLLWCSAATVVSLVGFALMKETIGAFAMILLIGLFMSGLFSIALIFSNLLIPGSTEQTTSKLVAASGIGGAAFTWLTGRFMEHVSVTFTLWFLVALALFFACLIGILAKMTPARSPAFEK